MAPRSPQPALAPPPRIVVVTRPTELEQLLARHGTRGQAAFHLAQRGLALEPIEVRHHQQALALARVAQAIPVRTRRTRIGRADLARFVFEPSDVVVAIGQDGLVANVAKYLDGQTVVGIAPDAEVSAGILTRHPPERAEELVRLASERRLPLEARTMVEAQLDDGQRLRALNEIFVGHRSHQSARYVLGLEGAGVPADRRAATERQSSSGLVVTTGTGATGWARSIARERAAPCALPAPTDPWLSFFVREAFPSARTGTTLTQGRLDEARRLEIESEMSEGGVLFGDGIEDDRIELSWGAHVRIGVAPSRLALAV